MEHHLTPKHPNSNLTRLVKDLNNSLTTFQPYHSETTRLITYALVATAVDGKAVYHYIKESERSPDCFSPKKELEKND